MGTCGIIQKSLVVIFMLLHAGKSFLIFEMNSVAMILTNFYEMKVNELTE